MRRSGVASRVDHRRLHSRSTTFHLVQSHLTRLLSSWYVPNMTEEAPTRIPQVPLKPQKPRKRGRRVLWFTILGPPALLALLVIAFVAWFYGPEFIPVAEIEIRNQSGEEVEIVKLEFDGKVLARNQPLTQPLEYTVFPAGRPARLGIEIRRTERGEIERREASVREGGSWHRTTHSIAIKPADIVIREWDFDTGGPDWNYTGDNWPPDWSRVGPPRSYRYGGEEYRHPSYRKRQQND